MFSRAFAILSLALCHPAVATMPEISFPITLTADEIAALESEACSAPFGANLEKADGSSRSGPWDPEQQANDRRAAVTCAPLSSSDGAVFRRTARCTRSPGRWSCQWATTLADLTIEAKTLRVEFPSESFPVEADVVRIAKDIDAAIRDWPSAPKGTIFAETNYFREDQAPAPLEGPCNLSRESERSWPEVDIELSCSNQFLQVTKDCSGGQCDVWFYSFAHD